MSLRTTERSDLFTPSAPPGVERLIFTSEDLVFLLSCVGSGALSGMVGTRTAHSTWRWFSPGAIVPSGDTWQSLGILRVVMTGEGVASSSFIDRVLLTIFRGSAQPPSRGPHVSRTWAVLQAVVCAGEQSSAGGHSLGLGVLRVPSLPSS